MTTFGDGVFQYGGAPVASAGPFPKSDGQVWFVDGTNGLDGNSGKSPSNAFKTIAFALEDNPDLEEFDVVYVFPRTMATTDTDPVSYDETLTISTPHLSLIGIGSGPVQANLPQIKIGGSSTTVMLSIEAPGVTVQGIGFNGASSTGGGISIGKVPSGTVIRNCHFKNCKTHATQGTGGGAIFWTSEGGGWQTLIEGCSFYKNVADIVLVGTTDSRPQDVYIRNCKFSGPAASVTVNIYGAGGSGFNGLYVDNCVFPCLPALSSGNVNMPVKLTGCVGSLTNCTFGTSNKSYGAAGDVYVPTTMLIANCHQEEAQDTTGEIGRT
jgi:hypothetical protein